MPFAFNVNKVSVKVLSGKAKQLKTEFVVYCSPGPLGLIKDVGSSLISVL